MWPWAQQSYEHGMWHQLDGLDLMPLPCTFNNYCKCLSWNLAGRVCHSIARIGNSFVFIAKVRDVFKSSWSEIKDKFIEFIRIANRDHFIWQKIFNQSSNELKMFQSISCVRSCNLLHKNSIYIFLLHVNYIIRIFSSRRRSTFSTWQSGPAISHCRFWVWKHLRPTS